MNSKLYSTIKGQGEVIILLHGLFGSSDNLGRIATELAKSYEVHSLDLRNHGKSAHSELMTYELMAQDVIHYMDQCSIDRAHILGHSMGGKVAMTLALQFSDRIGKLVVADIAPVTYEPHHNQIFKGLLALDLEQIQTRKQADQALAAYVTEKGIRQFLLKNLDMTSNGRFVWKMNLSAINGNYENILKGMPLGNHFDGKVIFIAGALSNYIKPDYREKTLSLFPNTEMKIIPETTHWLHAEKPRIFASICMRFLEK